MLLYVRAVRKPYGLLQELRLQSEAGGDHPEVFPCWLEERDPGEVAGLLTGLVGFREGGGDATSTPHVDGTIDAHRRATSPFDGLSLSDLVLSIPP